jgi:hypothetical protein
MTMAGAAGACSAITVAGVIRRQAPSNKAFIRFMISPPSRLISKQKYIAGIRMDISAASIAVITLFRRSERRLRSNYFAFVKDKFDSYVYETHYRVFILTLHFSLSIDRTGVFSLPNLKSSAASGFFIDAIIPVIDANFT